jgi:beta-N-acetylhexosaminidase
MPRKWHRSFGSGNPTRAPQRPLASDGTRTSGFGHGGFTGTELLIDPDQELVIVFLTNRQHPDLPDASIERAWQTVVQRVYAAVDT